MKTKGRNYIMVSLHNDETYTPKIMVIHDLFIMQYRGGFRLLRKVMLFCMKLFFCDHKEGESINWDARRGGDEEWGWCQCTPPRIFTIDAAKHSWKLGFHSRDLC